MKEILAETFYCLVSPDGIVQHHTISQEPESVEIMCDYLEDDLGLNYFQLREIGYTLEEIKKQFTKN